MRRKLAALTVLLLLLIPAISQKRRPRKPSKLTPRQIAALIYPSTVSIYMTEGKKAVRAGSGFVVGSGLVATCLHVVEGGGRIVVTTPAKDEYDRALDELRGEGDATVSRSDKALDLALLRVPSLRAVTPLKITKRQDYYIGDPVYTIGNPSGLEGTFSSGIISNFIQSEQASYLQFTAPVSAGSSGGPVVDDQGKVIAVVGSQLREGQSLNFAVMAWHLTPLLGGPAPTIRIDGNLRRNVIP